MSNIDIIHKFEKAVVGVLNIDGWELEWSGGNFEHYDAIGKTWKGIECVIEMKFRNEYYQNKLMEKYKFDKLMEMPDDIAKIYFVADPKGNYMFWLNAIKMEKLKTQKIWCPKTSFWNSKKVEKECYLIPEELAHKVNLNTEFSE